MFSQCSGAKMRAHACVRVCTRTVGLMPGEIMDLSNRILGNRGYSSCGKMRSPCRSAVMEGARDKVCFSGKLEGSLCESGRDT